jgi:hypothetical protein
MITQKNILSAFLALHTNTKGRGLVNSGAAAPLPEQLGITTNVLKQA